RRRDAALHRDPHAAEEQADRAGGGEERPQASAEERHGDVVADRLRRLAVAAQLHARSSPTLRVRSCSCAATANQSEHRYNTAMADLPVMLRVAGRRCVIDGRGAVSTRRARALLDAGAMVTVIAPEPSH